MDELVVKGEYNPEAKVMYWHIEPMADYTLEIDTEKLNKAILSDFYAAVEWLLKRGYDEYYEEYSRTINPAQQFPLHSFCPPALFLLYNAHIPLCTFPFSPPTYMTNKKSVKAYEILQY